MGCRPDAHLHLGDSRDRYTGREFLCANTHFDHRGQVARENSAKLLARKLPEMAQGSPVVLIGDFNTDEDREASAYGIRSSHPIGRQLPHHAPERSPEEATFHAFKGRTAGSRIDWILHTRELPDGEPRSCIRRQRTACTRRTTTRSVRKIIWRQD